jgi:hypothetical protein
MDQQATTTIYINNEKAKQALTELQTKLNDVNAAKKDAFEKGDFEAFDTLDKKSKSLQSDIDRTKNKFFDYKKVLDDISGASLKDLEKALAIVSLEFKKMRQTESGFDEKAEEVKKLKAATDDLRAKMKEVGTETEKSGGGFGRIKEIFTGVGIAELAGKALEGVKEHFKDMVNSTKGSADQWEFAVAGMKNGIEYFYKTLATGDWSNFITNMREAIKAGHDYAEAIDEVKERTMALSMKEADMLRENTQLEIDQRNKMLSNEDRIAAGDKRLENEKKATSDRIDLAKKDYDAQKELLINRTKLNESEILEIAKFYNEDTQLLAEKYNKQRQYLIDFQNRINLMPKIQAMFVDKTEFEEIGKAFQSTDKDIVEYAAKLRSYGTGAEDMIKNFGRSYIDVQKAINSGDDNTRKIQKQNQTLQLDSLKEDLSEQLSLVETNAKTQETVEKKKFAKGLIGEEEYNAELENINQRRLAGIANVYTKNLQYFEFDKKEHSDMLSKIAEANDKMLDFKVKQQEYINSILKSATSVTDIENQEYQGRLAKAGLFHVEQKDMNEKQLEIFEVLEADHAAKLNKIAYDATKQKKADLDSLAQDMVNDDIANNQKIIDARTEQYKQDLAGAGNNAIKRKEVEEKYKDDILILQLGQLQSSMAILTAFGISTVEIEKQIAAKKAEILKSGIASEDELIKKQDAARKQYNLVSFAEEEAAELAALEAKHGKELKSEEDYEAAKNGIKARYAAKWIGEYQKVVQSISNVTSGLQQVEITKSQTKYQKQLQQLEDSHDKGLISDDAYNKKKTAIEKKQAEDEKNIKKKYADVNFAIQVAQIIGSTALAVAKAVAESPLTFGLPWSAFAVIEGGVQVANAKAQRDQVKGLKSGGFTADSPSDDEPVDVVHANEFVANANAVRNPTIKPILDAIDMAQRSGTIRTINLPAIIAAQNVNRGFVQGGYTSNQTGISQVDSPQIVFLNDQLEQMIAANNAIMANLHTEIKKGIVARMSNERFDIDRAQWVDQKSDVTRS